MAKVAKARKGDESVGVFKKIITVPNGYIVECDNARVRIEIFNENTIRVNTIKAGKEFENFSYSVVGKPVKTKHQLSEEKHEIIIQTAKLKVVISKNPVRVSFITPEGQLINSDYKSSGVSWFEDEVTSYKQLQPDEIFVGMGEKTGNLNRRGSFYTHWNTDHFGYPPHQDPIYLSTPFYIGIHTGLCYGIFYDNTYKSVMDFGASNDLFSYFQAAHGEMDYYFFYDSNIAGILKHYTALTGRIQLPPLWSLGFQQCRYSYYPDTEVLNVARTFREKDIPADVIYLDIHYMDEYKVFTWHPKRFPNPKALVKQLREMGFHVVLIIDPGIKVEDGYEYYEDGLKKDLFVKYPDGTNYIGKVWPGASHFPDFTNPQVREWWGKNFKENVQLGIDGFWNDMNEPAAWGNHVPDNLEFDFEGIGATHRRAHNLYGMQMARSTYEGVKKQLGGKRPFVLTRAGFNGIQRYAAVWTGDNVSTDEHMLAGVRIINSMGLAGVSFAGYDVGGFAGEASSDLFARWIAVGAFTPFFRAHSMINSRDAEPWAFGEEVEEISRNYIKLRYKLMPYIYSLFYESSQTGMPVQRSLVFDFMNDEKIYKPEYQNQYLFGPSILVVPVTSTQNLVKVYLPAGGWYDLFTDVYHEGNKELILEVGKQNIPLFVQENAIITLKKAISHAGLDAGDTIELHLYKGAENQSFTHYEDDGETHNFERNGFYRREIRFDGRKSELIIGRKEGNYKTKNKKATIFFHGYTEEELQPEQGKRKLKITKTDYRFVEPVTDFDPLGNANDKQKLIKNICSVTIDWVDEQIKIGWKNTRNARVKTRFNQNLL